jgi:ACS family sodium-dependent inorganic phosphate cotransporter
VRVEVPSRPEYFLISEQVVQAVVAPRWKRRFTIVGLCFVAFMLCNMDRVNMSIAVLPMSEQYNWDSATVGLVQSSFFW